MGSNRMKKLMLSALPLALSPPSLAQVSVSAVLEAELPPQGTLSGDLYGFNVSMDGGTAVIGAPDWQMSGVQSDGEVQVFERGSGAAWSFDTTLAVGNHPATSWLGTDVSISGDTVAVGALSGYVQVFVRAGSAWQLQARLLSPSMSPTTAGFGRILALDGDTLLVGSQSGSCYVFVRSGTSWSLQAELPQAAAVDLDGDTALLSDAVWTRQGSVWSQQALLVPGDPENTMRYGQAAAIDGDVAVVGDFWGKDSPGDPQREGAAYVFERTGSTWAQVAKLRPRDTIPDLRPALFGHSVSVRGAALVIGAPGEDGHHPTGSVHLYTRSAAGWTPAASVEPDIAPFSSFGSAVDFDGRRILIGAFLAPQPGTSYTGTAYVYRLE